MVLHNSAMDSLTQRALKGSHAHPPLPRSHDDHPGQTLEDPVTGERFTFTHTAATTGAPAWDGA